MAVGALSNNLNLVGASLSDGWKIVEEFPRPGTAGATDLTGGYFSIGCIAERVNGTRQERAFVKVFDLAMATNLFPDDFMKGMKLVTDAYSSECSILKVCKDAKLDRVVQILDLGQLPATTLRTLPTPYIIFENADGDLRKLVSRSSNFEVAWKLRVLHDVAVGLQQLHRKKIAHQDLKPSNVLIFDTEGEGAKIGDLGRASHQGQPAPHDPEVIAGARAYAPPEQAFGITPERWEDQREGCDLYHLGSLAAFLFSGRLPNDFFRANLDKTILPIIWGGEGKGSYALALPFLNAELTKFVQEIAVDFPEWGSEELKQIILNACNQDYKKRGDPAARARVGAPLGIETFVSRFDRLARRALVKIS